MKLFKTNMEKKTRIGMGISVIVLLLIYLIANLMTIDWVKWVGIVIGFLLVLILVSEASIREYLHSKAYKSITWKDIIVWITFVVAVGVLMNTLLMFSIVNEAVPEWLLNFSKAQGSIITVSAILLAIGHILTPRLK